MAIQWFPGHMHLTRKAIAERIKDIDVVIEVLDARLPGSSANPMLAELTGHKPALKILNKQDLADPARTALWLDHYNALPGTRAVPMDATDPAPARTLIPACHALSPNRGGMAKPMRVLICGIPNVGKSTLINTMTNKRQAKTGDEAGVTKLEQRITLADDFYLWDTPGVLWPRIAVDQSGFHLAASGAVGRNAFDEEAVVLELLATLKGPYAGQVAARFKLDMGSAGNKKTAGGAGDEHDDDRNDPHAPTPSGPAALSDEELLEAIGRKRGALLGKGKVNIQKAAEMVLTEFRSGALGRITLETPAEFLSWQAASAARDEERDAVKRQKKSRGAAPEQA